MGTCSSNVYHDAEKGIEDQQMPFIKYAEQPDEEYKQLDTENDQKGDTAVEHIFKKTKTVYGQPPKDMRGIMIDWKTDYEIDLKTRPCPYDFPAFEFDRPADYDEKKQEEERQENEKKNKTKSKSKSNSLDSGKSGKGKGDEKRTSGGSKGSKEGSKGKNSKGSKEGSKGKNSKGSKEGSRGQKEKVGDRRKKRSANADLDQCSLEE